MSAARFTRAERLAQIAAGLSDGLTSREIAEELGVGYSAVRAIIHDPDGSKQKERRKRYQGVCVVCGIPTDGSNGRAKAPEYCMAHIGQNEEWVAKQTKWPAARIIETIQAWNSYFGEPPALSDWNPGQARVKNDEARALRADRLLAEGRIPWFTIVYNRFGSWNAALAAAGFEPRPAHGGAGNQQRRRSVRARQAA